MAIVHLESPAKIMLIEGLTMPEVTDDYLADIAAAAPEGSEIVVCGGVQEAAGQVADVDVILGIVNQALFAEAQQLRWVHAIASGVDMFMFDEFINSDVVLTGEKGLVGGHLADTGFGLLLALTRQIHTSIRLGADAWSQRASMRRVELELEGLTMGLVGFGGTGRAIAKRALAFGMKNIAVDEFPSPGDHGVDEVWGVDRLADLLAQSDVVAICCPLTSSTESLINHRTVAQMRPGAYLMNVTRGEIVDNDAIVAGLESGHLGGAALDVVQGEPLDPNHPLFTLPNVAMTPHTAGASQLRAPRNVARFVQNLNHARRGEPLVGVVDKNLGY